MSWPGSCRSHATNPAGYTKAGDLAQCGWSYVAILVADEISHYYEDFDFHRLPP